MVIYRCLQIIVTILEVDSFDTWPLTSPSAPQTPEGLKELMSGLIEGL